MASKGYLAKQERDLKREEMRHQNRRAREANAANVTGAGIRATGTVLGSLLKSVNDPEFYKKWPGNNEYYSTFPQFLPTSVPHFCSGIIDFDYNSSDPTKPEFGEAPCVVSAINYIPRLGYAEMDTTVLPSDEKFAINTSLSMVLANIGKANSRSVPSDPDVLGLYVLGTAEIMSVLGELKTDIEIVDYFKPEQPGVRELLLSARGVANVDYFINNVAEFRKIYKMYAAKFNKSFAIPADISYYKRRWFVSTAVFKDQDLKKAQIITFNRYCKMYGYVTNDTDGFEYASHVNNWFSDLNALSTFLRTSFERILYDDDFNTLCANIRAALKNENQLIKIEEEFNDMHDIPVFDQNLLQFHNIRTLPYDVHHNGEYSGKPKNLTEMLFYLNVTSSGVGLTQPTQLNYVLETGEAYNSRKYDLALALTRLMNSKVYEDYLDFYSDNASVDDILEATRLHTVYSVSCDTTVDDGITYANNMHVLIRGEGTETVMFIRNWGIIDGGESSKDAATFSKVEIDYNLTTPLSNARNIFCQIVPAQQLDWIFPCFYINGRNLSDQDELGFIAPVCQLGNYFPVGAYDMSLLHHACDLSLYYTDPSNFKSLTHK